MLVGADTSITSMASSEIYSAMQTGVLDAANTSSSSFVSYRIFEQVACYTWKEKFEVLPRVLPFIGIIIGVLYAMYVGLRRRLRQLQSARYCASQPQS